MDEIEEAIEEAKAQAGEHFTVKQLEKLRKSLKQKLEKLQGTDRKDDVVTFEQLGVDRLFVDESTGYRARTRFAKFFNLPELMAMFKEAADIKTSDQLHLPVPDAKFETVVVKPSEIQQDMVQALSERAAEVHSGSVDPSVDNMLKITSDGRKIGLDQRLMNSALPDDPNSKLNACVNNVLRIWNDTKEQKLTQLIFCDMSTPKGTVRSTSMMIFAPSCSTPVCPNRRSSSSTTQIRRTRKQNFSPRYAADRCVCCWAALPKWEQGPTSRRCS